MDIKLSEKDYFMNRSAIEGGLRGEMCKIIRINDRSTGEILHFICDDVSQGGWTTSSGRKFHLFERNGSCTSSGLGTFFLISATRTDDGGCLLKFTDDLNPDLP